MSYHNDLNRAHKERQKRLGMVPTVPVIVKTAPPPPPPQPVVEVSVSIPTASVTAFISTIRPSRVTVPMIMHAVAKTYGIGIEDMKQSGRRAEVCKPRQIAMCIAREMTNNSYPMIARHFGGRDHTTILHATRVVTTRAAADPELALQIGTIKEALVACCSPQ